jgi:hypothetical protein
MVDSHHGVNCFVLCKEHGEHSIDEVRTSYSSASKAVKTLQLRQANLAPV